MSGATEDLDIRDAAEHWPVASSTTLADGALVRLRKDMVRMPDGEVSGIGTYTLTIRPAWYNT